MAIPDCQTGDAAGPSVATVDQADIRAKWNAVEKRTWHPRSPETPGQVAFIERLPGV
jgi:hypothetical protein